MYLLVVAKMNIAVQKQAQNRIMIWYKSQSSVISVLYRK